jgi:hypothetical protein
VKRPKLTKQGVRDLGSSPKRLVEIPPECAHPRAKERGGHYICPDCGLTWDREAQA